MFQSYIFGRKGFPFFRDEGTEERNPLNTLELHYSEKEIKDGFIVRYNHIKNLYILFSNHMEFLDCLESLKDEEKCFYEVMEGTKSQKPHFDIDIGIEDFRNELLKSGVFFDPTKIIEEFDREIEMAIAYVVKACQEILAEKNIIVKPEEDFTVCTSHGQNKRSAHITLTSYVHTDHIEANAFFILVRERCNQYGKWVDESVYSKLQNWRIIGNQKSGSNRPKIFQEKWKCFDDDGKLREVNFRMNGKFKVNKQIYIFESTLLYNFGNKILPLFAERAGELNTNFKIRHLNYENGAGFNYKEGEADPEDIQKVKGLITEKLGCFPFIIANAYKYMIDLRRKHLYTCPVCQSQHQSQNPVVYIRGGNAYLNCRRSMAHLGKHVNLFLGMVYEVDENNKGNEEEEFDIMLEGYDIKENKEKGVINEVKGKEVIDEEGGEREEEEEKRYDVSLFIRPRVKNTTYENLNVTKKTRQIRRKTKEDKMKDNKDFEADTMIEKMFKTKIYN